MSARKTGRRGTTKKRAQRATSNVFAMFDQAQIQEFKEAFNMIDQNRDGFVDKEDLHDMLASLGKNPTDEYLEGMMNEAPGPINFTMFLTLFGERLQGTDPEEVIKNAFGCFDEENDGVVNEEKLRELLTTMGDRFTDEEVDEMFREAPIKNGLFNYVEFTRILKHGAKEQDEQECEMQISPVPVLLNSEDHKGSTGGSRPASRVRVTFFEPDKPLTGVTSVSSPDDSTNSDFYINNIKMTHENSFSNSYNRQMSVESGWDNPFRPDGDLSKEADQIVELIKEGKPINDETLLSKSPSVNEVLHTSTPYTHKLNASSPVKVSKGGVNGMEVQRGVVAPPSQGAAEHVTLKKKKGCCVLQ